MMDFGEGEEAPILAKRRFKPINRKTKIQVVFDEKARRDFLTGFRKRKLERKRKAQEELKQLLKEEKKRIKEKSKEEYKKMVKTYQPIPELEEKLAQLHEVENCTVSILELDSDLLAENNFIIGRNRVKYEDDDNKDGEDPVKVEKIEDDPFCCYTDENSQEKSSTSDNTAEVSKELKTKKEVKKEIKKQATKMVKKSNAFKQLNKLQQIKQKKKSNRKKNIHLMKLEKTNRKRNRKRGSND